MTDINLQTITPDTTLPTTGFLFGADSQASGSPSVYTVQSVATTLLGSTTLTGATITADAPVLNLAQTWNNAAITFTGLKLNATDTASAAGSLLLDIGTGGGTYASKFSVRKDGRVEIISINLASGPYGGNANWWSSNNLNISSTTQLSFGASDLILSRRDPANLRFGAADAAAPVAQKLSVQSVVAGTTDTAGADLTITGSQGTGTGAGGSIIFQVAPAGSSSTVQNALSTALTIGGNGGITGQDGATANALALRNGTSAQTFNLYNTYTDALNYSRLVMYADGSANYYIGTQKAGTGISASLFVGTGAGAGVAGNGSTTIAGSLVQIRTQYGNVFHITAAGVMSYNTDDANDIGRDAANRPRSVYVGTSVTPGRGVTVANLPTPSTGMIARVTDATAPVIGATVAGGGAAYALVNYNGANWTVIGV